MKRASGGMVAKLQLPGVVGGLFGAMEIAEEEIKAAQLTRVQGSTAFLALCPSPALRGKDLSLYRAHAREILQRIKSGADLRPATDAELLAVFSDTSLIAPFGRNAAAAFEALFARVMPEAKIDGEALPGGAWPGAISEVIEMARRKYTVSGRGVVSHV